MSAPSHLLLATSNEGKARELCEILSDLPISLLTLRDVPHVDPVVEAGSTFEENASLKAAGYATQTGLLTLADDSGLEVDALRGAPGVQSARYAGGSASDAERIQKLLAALRLVGESERSARFVSAVVIANGEGALLNTSVGKCEGRIALSPRGIGGFGFDPVFVPTGYDLTLAELKPETKNQISHRANALAKTRAYLQGLTAALRAG